MLSFLNFIARTLIGLEREATAVVTIRRLGPIGPCTVYKRVSGNTTRNTIKYLHIFLWIIRCLAQIVMNSSYLDKRRGTKGGFQKAPAHESLNGLDLTPLKYLRPNSDRLQRTTVCKGGVE